MNSTQHPLPVIRGITILKIASLVWCGAAGIWCIAFTLITLIALAVPSACLPSR